MSNWSVTPNDDDAVPSNNDKSTVTDAFNRVQPCLSRNHPELPRPFVSGQAEIESGKVSGDDGHSTVASGFDPHVDQRAPFAGNLDSRCGNEDWSDRHHPKGSLPRFSGSSWVSERPLDQTRSHKPVARVSPIVLTPPLQDHGELVPRFSPRESSSNPTKTESQTGSGSSSSSSSSSSPPFSSVPANCYCSSASLPQEMTSRAPGESGNSHRIGCEGVRTQENNNPGGVASTSDPPHHRKTINPDSSRSKVKESPGTSTTTCINDTETRRQRSELDREFLLRSIFYHPRLNRSSAKDRLRHSPTGTFLIRNSSDPRYEYVMSIRTRYGVTSVRLVRNPAGLILLDCDPAQADRMPTFPSVIDLIQGYLRPGSGGIGRPTSQSVYLGSSGQEDVALDLVRPFEESPPALAHLCRRLINGLLPARGRSDVIKQLLESMDSKRRIVVETLLNEYPYRI